jgi:hypothetical protein
MIVVDQPTDQWQRRGVSRRRGSIWCKVKAAIVDVGRDRFSDGELTFVGVVTEGVD